MKGGRTLMSQLWPMQAKCLELHAGRPPSLQLPVWLQLCCWGVQRPAAMIKASGPCIRRAGVLSACQAPHAQSVLHGPVVCLAAMRLSCVLALTERLSDVGRVISRKPSLLFLEGYC